MKERWTRVKCMNVRVCLCVACFDCQNLHEIAICVHSDHWLYLFNQLASASLLHFTSYSYNLFSNRHTTAERVWEIICRGFAVHRRIKLSAVCRRSIIFCLNLICILHNIKNLPMKLALWFKEENNSFFSLRPWLKVTLLHTHIYKPTYDGALPSQLKIHFDNMMWKFYYKMTTTTAAKNS